jgi:hypothetical protein
LTRQRFWLNGKLRAAQRAENPEPFTLEDLTKFFKGFHAPSEAFTKEVQNILAAVVTGVAPEKPSFDTPDKQLAWGAALGYLKSNPDLLQKWTTPVETGELKGSSLWEQMTATRTAYREIVSHAHHVREALRDRDMKYGWSEPLTGFTHDRQKNIINIDFMQSLVTGFEHARADVYREIGFSLLSVTYPVRMQEIYKEMNPLLRKAQQSAGNKKAPKLKPEEYKQLRLLSAEWELRHMMFNAAEENVANKFVANMGQQMLQDYGVSLNNAAVTHRAVGLTRIPSDGDASEELRRYMNLCNAVQLSFFQNNGLFDDTDDGWFRVGIDPNMVRKTATLAKRPDDAKDDADGVAHADFTHLRELCGGIKGLENQQPKPQERLYGKNNLAGSVARADLARKAIIEDIWNLYAEDLIQKILQQANDQIDQQMKDEKKKQQDKQDGQDGDEQDGDEQDGDDGQESDSQKQGKGKGKPPKGKKPKGKPQRGGEQGDPQDADDLDDDAADSQEKQKQKREKQKQDKQDKKDKSQKGDESDGEQDQDSGDEKADPSQGKEGKLGADEENTVPVDGVGDMPAVDKPTEMPSDEQSPDNGNDADDDADGEDADADGNDADGEESDNDADGEDADGEESDEDGEKNSGDKTEEELEQQLRKAEKAEQEAQNAKAQAGKGQEGKGKPQPSKDPNKKAGSGDGKPLGELAKQDWTEYTKRIAELQGPIQRVRKLFKKIQEKQLQREQSVSPDLDMLPKNGELKERFNNDAHRAFIIKKRTGQLEERDLKRFHQDAVKLVPAEIDIVIMIDGSGSMGQAIRGTKNTPLDSALQASAILYEAAAGKDMKINIYVGMWGEKNPPIIIKPGDDRVHIGQAMQAARKGLSSGTDFAPAVKKIAKVIGEERGKSGVLSGFTHVLILSDGDIFDMPKAKENIETMFEYSDRVTFDAAVITAEKGTNMEKMAKSITGHKPAQDVGITLEGNPNEVPMAIVGLLLNKIQKCGSFIAIPKSQKRRAIQKAHNKMEKKP